MQLKTELSEDKDIRKPKVGPSKRAHGEGKSCKSSKGHGAGAHRQKLAGLVDYQIGEH